MSLDGSFDLKEQVKQAIDIVDLVGQFIPLRRQGRLFVGLCPWHEDTRPSFQVNPVRQSFKCWVCDIGGDVISFLMKMEGVSFPEALKMLAERANIEVKPSLGPRDRAVLPGSEGPVDKKALYAAMAWAEAEFHECLLHAPEAEPARAYLAERGLSAESIEAFHLGYAPDRWDWLLGRARATKHAARTLETVGLIGRSPNSGRVYDRFKGRVLFSIRDAQTRPVATGGRILPGSGNTSPAKYINSPETPLFAKHRLLYGLDRAKEVLRRGKSVVVMEGYTDVIIAHQFGFREAVAVLGTALGSDHIRTLKHYTDRITLLLDGDEAGQKRAAEVLELFVAQQVDLRVVTLPDDLDPCDFLLQHGAEALADILEHRALDALEHAVQTETRGFDIARDVHRASQALDRILGIVSKGPRLTSETTRESRLREELLLQRLAASFRIDERAVRERLTELRRQAVARPSLAGAEADVRRPVPARSQGPRPTQTTTAPSAPAETFATCDPLEKALLQELLAHPECVAQAVGRLSPEQFCGPLCRLVFETACRFSDEGDSPTFERLMLEFDDPKLQNLLVALDEDAQAKGPSSRSVAMLVEELIARFEFREEERRRPALTAALREGQLDEVQQLEELRRIRDRQRKRQGLTRPADPK